MKIDMFMVLVTLLFVLGVIGVVSIIVILVQALGLNIYYSTLRYEATPDTAKVKGKKYEKPYITTTMMPIGKVIVPQTHMHDEKYNVYLMYKGEKHTFNSRELYQSLKIGDTIPVTVNTGYDKKGNAKHVFLTIGPDESVGDE